jgi:hypothetical protein
MNTEDLIRRVWMVVINSAMIYIVWPRSTTTDQLNRVIGNLQSTPFWGSIREHPWQAIAVVILASGIVVEFVKPRFAVIFNVGYYCVALGVALWGITKDWHEVPSSRIYTGVLLYTVPVTVILLLNLFFYRRSLFRRTANAS